jgi:hypothetical protein
MTLINAAAVPGVHMQKLQFLRCGRLCVDDGAGRLVRTVWDC